MLFGRFSLLCFLRDISVMHEEMRLPNLKLEHIWEDERMIELLVSVDDGLFSGVTQIYSTWGSLRDLRNRLSGFPHSTDEVVEETMGEPGGYSYLRVRFHCTDGVGHARAEVELEKSQQQHGALDFRSKVKLYIPFEAGMMDRFVLQIDALLAAKKGSAQLAGHAV
jgi:hypothetical protein